MTTDISSNRLEELRYAWEAETSDPETQEWREELSDKESLLIASWDRAYNLGVRSLCEQILEHEVSIATRMLPPELHV